MSSRIFCLRWPAGNARLAARANGMLERVVGACPEAWETLIDRFGVLLAVKRCVHDGPPLVLPDQLGVVLGRLFRRDGEAGLSRPLSEIALDEAHDLARAGGAGLVRSHWGTYCAFLHDRSTNVLRIVRDPMGARPVFYTRHHDVSAAFTHARDMLSAGCDPPLDAGAIGCFLSDPRIVSASTGFCGVGEILAGCEARFTQDGVSLACLWRPTQARTFIHDDFEGALAAVRAAAREVGRAWREGAPVFLHRLSGGLDSAAALSLLASEGAPRGAAALNQFSLYRESDEREIARAVARRFGIALIEFEAQAERVDYRAVLEQEPEMKPTLAALGFADKSIVAAAGDLAGAALTSGQGGDQVFHRSARPSLVGDALRDGCGLRASWRIAYHNALLARRPVWAGVAAGLKHGILRLPHAGLVQRESEMTWAFEEETLAELERSWRAHPWADSAESPARQERVRRIADLQHYHQPSPLTAFFQPSPVLASQPLVEACLSVAPYLMAFGGRDRALERAAFAEQLPSIVLERQFKGDTTRFVAEVLERNKAFAREILLEGELVRRELVTREIVAALLAPRAVFDAKAKVRLMRAIAAELWLRRVEQARKAQGHAQKCASA